MHSVISHTVFLIIVLRIRFVRIPIPIRQATSSPNLTEIATPCETQGEAASAPLDSLVLPVPSANLEIQFCNSPQNCYFADMDDLIISCEKRSLNSNTGTYAPSTGADM